MFNIKKSLFYLVKYSPVMYSLYYHIGSFCLTLLRLFVKPDDKLILFSSFGGRKYDDSPKVIYEHMLKDERFREYKFIWAFVNPQDVNLPDNMKVKCDTLRYYITALKARVWVTNSSIERGLSFKRRETFYFNTWHGTPLKKMGCDLPQRNKSFRPKSESKYDVFLAQGEYEADIFLRAFSLKQTRIHTIGLPRNDIFAHYSLDYQLALRENLNIPKEKNVILYAPTFREYERSGNLKCKLDIPVNLETWKKRLGESYVLLFRAHYEVAKNLEIIDDEFVRDMSTYPQLEDLMIVSDILVSDYSSIFFDYSIMHKPMCCFAYDYDRYTSERGMYFDIRDVLPTVYNEKDLIDMIKNGSKEDMRNRTRTFQEKYVTAFGNAGEQSVNIIANTILI